MVPCCLRLAPRHLLSPALLTEFEDESRLLDFLAAIRERPGSSNQDIGDDIGVQDAGQLSRIGRRLQQNGLASAARVGRTNSWNLTPRGVQMLQLLDQGVRRPRRSQAQRALG